ncbi:hypothetical protein V8F06_007924 [Rhypophila decipiens]
MNVNVAAESCLRSPFYYCRFCLRLLDPLPGPLSVFTAHHIVRPGVSVQPCRHPHAVGVYIDMASMHVQNTSSTYALRKQRARQQGKKRAGVRSTVHSVEILWTWFSLDQEITKDIRREKRKTTFESTCGMNFSSKAERILRIHYKITRKGKKGARKLYMIDAMQFIPSQTLSFGFFLPLVLSPQSFWFTRSNSNVIVAGIIGFFFFVVVKSIIHAMLPLLCLCRL